MFDRSSFAPSIQIKKRRNCLAAGRRFSRYFGDVKKSRFSKSLPVFASKRMLQHHRPYLTSTLLQSNISLIFVQATGLL